MSTFKPYLVQAHYGGIQLDVFQCRRTHRWRLQRFPTPGTDGDRTAQHGRGSIVDSVSARMDVDTYDQLIDLASRGKPQVWQHPLHKPIWARVEDVDSPASYGLYGWLMVSFTVVEHRSADTAQLIKPSSASARAKADAAFADLGLALDGLDDIPGTAGSTLSSAWGDLGDAYASAGDAFDAVESGAGIWRDLSRAADTVASAGSDMIDAVRNAEEYLEAGAQDLIEGTSSVIQTVRDAVDAVESAGERLVSFTVRSATDVYGMILDAGLEITEQTISSIMSANGIEDPLAVLPGKVITIPTRIEQ